MGALILPESNAKFAEKLRFLQNAIGAVPSPFDSWLVQRGLKTLHLRMKQHGLNALAVARALENTPGVEEVIYPGLPGKTEASRRKYELAWSVLSSHARKFIGAGEGDGPPVDGFPIKNIHWHHVKSKPQFFRPSHSSLCPPASSRSSPKKGGGCKGTPFTAPTHPHIRASHGHPQVTRSALS